MLALITPSYAPDFERCRLLTDSLGLYGSGYATHYIIVDRSDLKLFSALSSARTVVLTKEDVLPRWLRKLPAVKQLWVSSSSLPVRGWIVQQLAKLAICASTTEDLCVFLDSDCFLIRPFDFGRVIGTDGSVRLWRGPDTGIAEQGRWHVTASQLLGTPADTATPGYIGNPICWRRDNVVKMLSRIEEATGRSWHGALSNTLRWSEYILYGRYCEDFLGKQSGHTAADDPWCAEHWDTHPLSPGELVNWFQSISPDISIGMISAKSHTSVEAYRGLVLK